MHVGTYTLFFHQLVTVVVLVIRVVRFRCDAVHSATATWTWTPVMLAQRTIICCVYRPCSRLARPSSAQHTWIYSKYEYVQCLCRLRIGMYEYCARVASSRQFSPNTLRSLMRLTVVLAIPVGITHTHIPKHRRPVKFALVDENHKKKQQRATYIAKYGIYNIGGDTLPNCPADWNRVQRLPADTEIAFVVCVGTSWVD